MDIAGLPPDTCPICRRRALRFEPDDDGKRAEATCAICGSRFTLDRATRRSRHTEIAADFKARYPEIAARLLAGSLTRRDVFELTAPASWQPPAGAGMPASGALVWVVLIAAGLMIAIVCACATALLLGPGMAQTRQIIAAAGSRSTPALTETVTPLSPLVSPLQTPGAQPAATGAAAGNEAVPIETSASAPPTPDIMVDIATLPAEAIPTIDPQSRAPLLPDQPQPATPPPTDAPPADLPATDTPPPPPTEPPTPENTPPTVTNIPPPAASSNIITGPIAITALQYQGDPTLNEANEFVEIANQSSGPVDLSNWTLRAVSTNRTYTFSNGMIMFPGDICRIYTSSPIAFGTCGTLTFGADGPVWSNNGDIAELRDAGGALVSRWVYVGGAP